MASNPSFVSIYRGADTGDTGDTSDTGDTGDTGDTSDTGDTGDTGDTSDTSDTSDTGEVRRVRCQRSQEVPISSAEPCGVGYAEPFGVPVGTARSAGHPLYYRI